MMEKGILFLARLKSSDYKKEQAALSAPDTWVDIHLDKSRIRHYKGTDIGRRMEKIGHITLRMVKVPLPENQEEVLLTNLPSEPFGCQQIYEDISKNLVPIRPDCHYHRTKGQLGGKYSNTHKRAY